MPRIAKNRILTALVVEGFGALQATLNSGKKYPRHEWHILNIHCDNIEKAGKIALRLIHKVIKK